jgi:phosphopantetheinyl transferase
MPLVYQQNINGYATIGVWHITEEESFFLEKVSAQKEIHHPHKRLQHLAGRYLLKEINSAFPVNDIIVASSGRPYLEDDKHHFSISHCGNYAAVIISDTKTVGIDIEKPDQRIEKIKNKFTVDRELELFENIDFSLNQKLTFIWSIKEAMFKWFGDGVVDFKKHLFIENFQLKNEVLIAQCYFKKNVEIKITAESIMIEGNILTHVCEVI